MHKDYNCAYLRKLLSAVCRPPVASHNDSAVVWSSCLCYLFQSYRESTCYIAKRKERM